MNTLIDTPSAARHVDGQIEIEMTSGQVLRFSVADNPRLKDGSHVQLSDVEISPFGVHWPQLDEDLSMRGLFEGRHGQN
jgi:hypothetical protein